MACLAILSLTGALAVGIVQSDKPSVPAPATFSSMSDFMREAVMMKIASTGPYEQAEGVTDLVALSLSDINVRVRTLGLTTLWTLGMAQMSASQGGRPLTSRPPDRAIVQPVLTRLLNDSEAQTRQMALDSLVVLGGKRLDPELQERLLKIYASDPAETVRSSAIARLREFSDGARPVQEAIVTALDDASPRVQQHALLAVANWKPARALARVAILSESEHVGVRHSAIQALGRYGADAQAYLPALEGRLQDETDVQLKRELQLAAASIRRASASVPK